MSKVYFVGAGPGDPELITLKAKHLIEKADVIVYAGSLIPKRVLACVRKDAELHDSAPLELGQFMEIMIQRAREGKLVLRLQSGDPSVFGAMQEQIDILKAEGIEYEIVPGVSSFQAAAALLGRELTCPEVAQTVILSRASGDTKVPPKEELVELAKVGATLCLFLSARLIDRVQEDLLTGYPPDTPFAVVYRATWPDEKVLVGELKDLARAVKDEKIVRSAIILVGAALKDHGTRSKLYDKEFSHIFRRKTPEPAQGGSS
jgi:precorrin-4/cobalt-precorrin-4 C11-methyltransferase